MPIKAIAFDVANTLLHKDAILSVFRNCFLKLGIDIPITTIRIHHHIIKEHTFFPDVTTKSFYDTFNAAVCISLGIHPVQELLEELYKNAREITWSTYEDTKFLEQIELPLYIFSNFNSKLENLLKTHFSKKFQAIVVSEKIGAAKPSQEFYKQAIKSTNVNTEEILYIGDSYKLDYLPATALGVKTLLIDRFNMFPGCESRIDKLSKIKEYIK